MMPNSDRPKRCASLTAWQRVVLISGLVLPQIWLYGPAMVGWKVLLPLDILDNRRCLPDQPSFADLEIYDQMLSDLILTVEPNRQGLVRQLWSGTFPLINPLSYAGGPDAVTPKFSFHTLLSATTESPVILGWLPLLIALLAGMGMFVFARRVLEAGYWPSCLAAWCYPLSGYFVVWQGYSLDYTIAWLPWLFWGVWELRRSGNWLAWLTVVLSSWQMIATRIDIAGQALLGAGLWAVFLFCRESDIGSGNWLRRLLGLASSWMVAFALAGPFILPFLEYGETGLRPKQRASGVEERPPIGLKAAPLLVAPFANGLTRQGWTFISDGNVPESAASGYAGLIAALVLAPFAWSRRATMPLAFIFLALGLLAVSWQLDLPGFVQVLRMPVLNAFSHNRFVFLYSFATLSLATLGLENLLRASVPPVAFRAVVTFALLTVALWAGYRSQFLPVEFDIAEEAASRLSWSYIFVTLWSLLGIVAINVATSAQATPIVRRNSLIALCVLQLAELLVFATGQRPLTDWQLYYPLPAEVKQVVDANEGRFLSVRTLPPRVGEFYGWRDVRGYDAIDPERIVTLLELIREPAAESPPYALTQYFIPMSTISDGRIYLPPILNMFDVRMIILPVRIDPSIKTIAAADGFYVFPNPDAVGRAFVPKRVAVRTEYDMLVAMKSPDFLPKELSFVEHPVDLAPLVNGTVELVSETANSKHLRANLDAKGLVVVTDLWDAGWKATIDGQPAPVIRVNFALQGVVVPAGKHDVELYYWPGSFQWGLYLAAGGLLTVIAVMAIGSYKYYHRAPHVTPS